MEKSKKPVVPPVDPFEEKKWLIFLVCFSPLRDNIYKAYKCIVILFYITNYSIVVYTIYVVSSDKAILADVLHVYACSLWLLMTIVCRYVTDSSLMKMRDIIRAGIYNYDEEELEYEQLEKLRGIKKDVLRKSNSFVYLIFGNLFFIAVIIPLCQYFFSSEDKSEHLVNPYLPHPVYYPFNTETVSGFMMAFFVDIIYWIYLYSTAVLSNDFLLYSTVYLKVHFFVLNYSIKNIHRRAYRRFAMTNYQHIEEASLDQLKQRRDFQQCLRTCLKANVQHHQALLRFRNLCQPYNGFSLLLLTTVVAIIYATILFLLFQNVSLIMNMKCAGTFLVEQNYAFLICFYGQEATSESGAVFDSLYSTSWMYYDKDFKQILHIMMCNSINPMRIKAHLLDFTASLSSFSDLESGVYKIISIWRQSDKLK